MSTKITTPTLIDFPNETLSSENTSGVILPKGLDGIETLIVGGGAGGGSGAGNGGGGAGGVLTGFLKLALNTGYSIQVGAGGAANAGAYGSPGNTGSNSFIGSWIANAGGIGGSCQICGTQTSTGTGTAGGSGGGGGGSTGAGHSYSKTGGASNQNNISPLTGHGHAGGSYSVSNVGYVGAGGGGAGGPGADVATSTGAAGGIGIISTIIDTTIASTNNVGEVSGSDVYFAGGGGGSTDMGGYSGGAGGLGGGGTAGNGYPACSTPGAGTPATGGGGTGGCYGSVVAGSAGGSGVIILKYPDSLTCTLTSATGLTEIVDTTSVSGFKISIFKVSSEGTDGTGTITFTGTSTIPLNPSAGEFRYNQTDKVVEFYNGSEWKQIADEYISGQPSTCICNFPTTGTSLFQFEDNLNDTCGNYNITSSNNITYDSSGKFGKAADFASSYADIPYTTFGEASCSISFWLYPHTTSGQHYFMTKYQNAAGYGILMQIYSNSWYFNYYNTATGTYAPNLSGYSSASPNTWYHVVMTHELNTSVTYYINNQTNIGGTSSTFTSLTGSPSINTAPLRLGWYWTGGGYWDGLMDQVRIFDSCLTASQVTELYNEVPCT